MILTVIVVIKGIGVYLRIYKYSDNGCGNRLMPWRRYFPHTLIVITKIKMELR